MMSQLGVDGVLLIFTVISLIGGVLIKTLIPETKGKSIEEILMMLEKWSHSTPHHTTPIYAPRSNVSYDCFLFMQKIKIYVVKWKKGENYFNYFHFLLKQWILILWIFSMFALLCGAEEVPELWFCFFVVSFVLIFLKFEEFHWKKVSISGYFL